MRRKYPTRRQREILDKVEQWLLTLYDMARAMRDTAHDPAMKQYNAGRANGFAEAIDVVRTAQKGRL